MRKTALLVGTTLVTATGLLFLGGCSSEPTREASAPTTETVVPSVGTTSETSPPVVQAPFREIGQASGAEIATIGLFPYSTDRAGWLQVNGAQLAKSDSNAQLFALLGCTYGCSDDVRFFNLPNATGPLAKFGGTTGVPGNISWQISQAGGEFPDGGPITAYPNQVVFTGNAHDSNGRSNFSDRGFTKVDLGSEVGPNISSWVAPANWPAPEDPSVGELRLFRKGSKLPVDWIQASGQLVDAHTPLGELLAANGYLKNGKAQVPQPTPVGDYTWAIAQSGFYPAFQ